MHINIWIYHWPVLSVYCFPFGFLTILLSQCPKWSPHSTNVTQALYIKSTRNALGVTGWAIMELFYLLCNAWIPAHPWKSPYAQPFLCRLNWTNYYVNTFIFTSSSQNYSCMIASSCFIPWDPIFHEGMSIHFPVYQHSFAATTFIFFSPKFSFLTI